MAKQSYLLYLAIFFMKELIIFLLLAAIIIEIIIYYRKIRQDKIFNLSKRLEEVKQETEDIKKQKELAEQCLQHIKNNKEEVENDISFLENQYKIKLREYSEKDKDLNQSFLLKKENLEEQIINIMYELEEYKKMNAAVIEKLVKENNLNKQYFNIELTDEEDADIEYLQGIRKHIHKPRIISKLIWQTYIQPKSKVLFNLIFGNDTICGIYKIENINDGMCYIGQSVDIKKRFNQHLQRACGIDCPDNKLYKAMQQEGIQNFSFDILEECPKEKLNEKESYYIGFYNSCLYGYNSTEGNNG